MTDFFTEMTMSSVIVRLVFAALAGGLVGIERANKRYAAGIRTFALVCLGSALATVTGLYMAEMGSNVDISRLPGQVLCGIGFLGAGTIMVTARRQIRGLTTAAGLWVTSAMGIAIGAGFVVAAVVCLVLVLCTTYFMFYISRYVESHTRTIGLYIELERKEVETMLRYVREQGYLIISIERRNEPLFGEGDITMRIELDLHKRYYHPQLVDDIMSVEGVHYVEEIV